MLYNITRARSTKISHCVAQKKHIAFMFDGIGARAIIVFFFFFVATCYVKRPASFSSMVSKGCVFKKRCRLFSLVRH